jgi:hypothetical protein
VARYRPQMLRFPPRTPGCRLGSSNGPSGCPLPMTAPKNAVGLNLRLNQEPSFLPTRVQTKLPLIFSSSVESVEPDTKATAQRNGRAVRHRDDCRLVSRTEVWGSRNRRARLRPLLPVVFPTAYARGEGSYCGATRPRCARSVGVYGNLIPLDVDDSAGRAPAAGENSSSAQ